jgi:hypothetical protein
MLNLILYIVLAQMLLIKGTMSAISAGMLIYAATVEMITGNFVLVVSTVVMDMDMDISIILISLVNRSDSHLYCTWFVHKSKSYAHESVL